MRIGQLVTPWFYVDNLDCTPEELLKTIELAEGLIRPSPHRGSIRPDEKA